MIYPIVIYGDEVLRKHCHEIASDYPGLKQLVEDMFLTLDEAEGVGLAAPQIGKDIRLFIVDCTPWAEDDPSCADYKRAFINPEIYAYSDEKKTYNEGCLSFPGIHADVPRSLSIRMRYMDTDFVEHDEEFTGLKAWVIQHEYDHIEGVVFTDPLMGRGSARQDARSLDCSPSHDCMLPYSQPGMKNPEPRKVRDFFVCRLLRVRIGMRHRC